MGGVRQLAAPPDFFGKGITHSTLLPISISISISFSLSISTSTCLSGRGNMLKRFLVAKRIRDIANLLPLDHHPNYARKK